MCLMFIRGVRLQKLLPDSWGHPQLAGAEIEGSVAMFLFAHDSLARICQVRLILGIRLPIIQFDIDIARRHHTVFERKPELI